MPDREKDSDRERDRDRRRYRSRSRDRDSYRDRDRERERDRRDRREKSRSPRRRKHSPEYLSGPSGKHEEDTSNLSQEEKQMHELMGFAGFHSTKGKKVEGNNQGAVHVIMKRKYRQYMNRKGGFNRPLDFVA